MCTSKVSSVSLPAEMLRRVEELARAEDRTISELVREAIRTYESIKAGMSAVQPPVTKKAARTVQ
jgi:metal-responsive CopG/Arc/MetJ family transcriptional regulator